MTHAEDFDQHAEFTGFFAGNDGYRAEFRSICEDADKRIAELEAQLEAARKGRARALDKWNEWMSRLHGYMTKLAQERERNKALAEVNSTLFVSLARMVSIGYEHEPGCHPSEGIHTEGCRHKSSALENAISALDLCKKSTFATKPCTEESNAIYPAAVHNWFGLSYASYLVLPRLVLQHMPMTWQEAFVALLEQIDETFEDFNPPGGYHVRLKGEDGRFIPHKWNDYRHGTPPNRKNRTRFTPLDDASTASFPGGKVDVEELLERTRRSIYQAMIIRSMTGEKACGEAIIKAHDDALKHGIGVVMVGCVVEHVPLGIILNSHIDCNTCDHFNNGPLWHCYMFEKKPLDCQKHTGKGRI